MSKELQASQALAAQQEGVIFTMQLFQAACKGNNMYNPNQNPRMVPKGWNSSNDKATGWDILEFMLPKAAANGLINSIDKRGNTILHLCAQQGKNDVVDFLLKHMALDKISIVNVDGQTATHLAALKGHTETFGKIFKIIPKEAMQLNNYGTNCFHLSLTGDHIVDVNPKIAKIIIYELKLLSPELLFIKCNGISPLEQALLKSNQYPELKEVITELLFIIPEGEKFELFNKIPALALTEQELKVAVKEAAGLKLIEAIEAKNFIEARIQMSEANNHGVLEKVANQAFHLCLSNGADNRTVEILLNFVDINCLLKHPYEGANVLRIAIGHNRYDLALKVINKCTDNNLLFIPDDEASVPLDLVLAFVTQGQDLPNQREVFNKLLCAMPAGYHTAVEGQQGRLEIYKSAALFKAQVENLMIEEGVTEEAATQKVIEEQNQKVAIMDSIVNLASQLANQLKDALDVDNGEAPVDLEGAAVADIPTDLNQINLSGHNNSEDAGL